MHEQKTYNNIINKLENVELNVNKKLLLSWEENAMIVV